MLDFMPIAPVPVAPVPVARPSQPVVPLHGPQGLSRGPDGLPLFSIPTPNVLAYVQGVTGRAFPDPARSFDPVRWHRILRDGFRHPLHLNLGIPGLEEPVDPIEEHAETLLAASLFDWPQLPVILSGELEIAVQRALISEKALIDLRNKIRVSS
jgi:hypothetical protein